MADFCDNFENVIRSVSAITDRIGENAACKVFPDMQDQRATGKYIVYAEAGGDSDEHLTASSGIAHTVLQVWSFGDTRREANELAEILRRELKARNNEYWGTQYVTEVSCSAHRDSGIDPAQDRQSKPKYWTRRTFDIWHSEVV